MIATEASGSAPSSAAVPEAPKDNLVVNPLPNSNQPQGVVVPKERDTSATAKKDSGTAQTTEVVPTIPSSQAVVKPLSVAELPSPPSSPPSSPPPLVPSNIPPPPQHPPPTPEELAARAPAFAKAREAVERNQEEEERKVLRLKVRRSQHLLVKPHLQGGGTQKEIGPTHLCLLICCLEKPGSRLSLLENSVQLVNLTQE